MKNFLIKHAQRKVQSFLKLAQDASLATIYKQLTTLIQETVANQPQLVKQLNTATNKLAMNQLVYIKDFLESKSLSGKNKVKLLNLIHIACEQVPSLVESDAKIDDETEKFAESDFYAEYEDILLNLKELLEEQFNLDITSEEYEAMNDDITFNSATSDTEDSFEDGGSDEKLYPEDLEGGKDSSGGGSEDSPNGFENNLGGFGGKVKKGMGKRATEAVESFQAEYHDKLYNQKIKDLYQKAIKTLEQKIPLGRKYDETEDSEKESDNPRYFVKREMIFGPQGGKREKVTRTKNPKFDVVMKQFIDQFNIINRNFGHLKREMDKHIANYLEINNKEIGAGIIHVAPKYREYYEQVLALKLKVDQKGAMIKQTLGKDNINDAIRDMIDVLERTKDNPDIDITKGVTEHQYKVIEKYLNNFDNQMHEWAGKSHMQLSKDRGQYISAYLSNIGQKCNDIITTFEDSFFEKVLFQTYVQNRHEGQMAMLGEFFDNQKQLLAAGQKLLVIRDKLYDQKNNGLKLSAEDKSLVSKPSVTAAKNAIAQHMKKHKELLKLLKKKILNDITKGLLDETSSFEDPSLEALRKFFVNVYSIRNSKNSIIAILEKILKGEHPLDSLDEIKNEKVLSAIENIKITAKVMIGSPARKLIAVAMHGAKDVASPLTRILEDSEKLSLAYDAFINGEEYVDTSTPEKEEKDEE